MIFGFVFLNIFVWFRSLVSWCWFSGQFSENNSVFQSGCDHYLVHETIIRQTWWLHSGTQGPIFVAWGHPRRPREQQKGHLRVRSRVFSDLGWISWPRFESFPVLRFKIGVCFKCFQVSVFYDCLVWFWFCGAWKTSIWCDMVGILKILFSCVVFFWTRRNRFS